MPTFSLSDPIFWLQFLYFFFGVFVAFYIPGFLLLRNIYLPKIFHISLSITTGLALFAFQGYIFGYLQIRYLTYLYLFVCIGIWLFSKRKKRKNEYDGRYRIGKYAWVIIIIGSIMQLSTIWFTGMIIDDTAFFCCGDSNDNIIYGSLSQKIIHSIPPEHPGLTGEIFYNYHYWSNIVVGEMSRVFGLPVFQTQFQFSTVLIAPLTGILFLSLIWILGGSNSLGTWTLFFFYFGSDAVYWLITLLKSAPMFSMSSLEDGAGFLANYPRAMAVMVGLASMTMLFYTRKKPAKLAMIITALLFSMIVGTKIYIAFFMFVGLFCLAVFDLIKHKSITSLIIGFITSVIVMPIYLRTNAGAGGLYYLGFWRAQNFIVQPWLNLFRLEQARIIYEADNKWIQVMCYNILFTVIYVVSIFGTKVIALFNSGKSLRQLPPEIHVFLIPSIIISFILGFFYNQVTGDSNTFNFLVSVFIFLSIYAALVMNQIFQKKKNILFTACALIIFILTIPRPIYRTYKNITGIINKKSFSISKNILDASKAIRRETKTSDTFLVNQKYFIFDKNGSVFSLLTDRPMYFSGESVFEMVKVKPGEVEKRKEASSVIFGSYNIIKVALYLKNNPVTYIIDGPMTRRESTQSASFLKTVYKNSGVRVRKVMINLIPESVFDDYIESTQASMIRFKELTKPYIL